VSQIKYDMTPVVLASKGIARQHLIGAIRDGRDAAPVEVMYVDETRPLGVAGNRPTIPGSGVSKYKVIWEVEQVATDGDFVGRLVWKLMGREGTYPVCVDYVGPVPPGATPTFFSARADAEACAAKCALLLREQFAVLFQE